MLLIVLLMLLRGLLSKGGGHKGRCHDRVGAQRPGAEHATAGVLLMLLKRGLLMVRVLLLSLPLLLLVMICLGVVLSLQ